MALAGLTAVALLGGVMAAAPAEAGKKRKKSVKIVQNARGGDARTGNGGNGGNGGNVFSFGGAGTPGTPATGPGVGVTNAQLACAAGVLVNPAAPPFTPANIVNALTAGAPPCFPGTPPAAFVDCLVAASQAGGITAAEVIACGAVTPGTPATVGGGGGGVGGAGGAGAASGNATGGAGGNNVISVGP